MPLAPLLLLAASLAFATGAAYSPSAEPRATGLRVIDAAKR